ncbi:MAG: hypothetical protein K8L97_28385 [Anaerolineae bacterium]|nr:hypothetical protein [Anaerolineae bacterium]
MSATEFTANLNSNEQQSVPLTEPERNAMRAYLQRCEVRLSTLHRVGQAFFGGAGLLVLIPVFFKDAVDSLIIALLTQTTNQFREFGSLGLIMTGVLFLCILYPLLLSLTIPLYGVYLLLKDIIHFYFTIYTPGFSENLINPTFALTGVLFSVDESPTAKQEIMRYQYAATQMGFMIPFSQERQELYFDTIIEKTKGEIIPESRRIERLKELDVLPPDYNNDKVDHFNAALGIARSLDRTLVHEVAVTEMALVRHVLYLRRLVLRYVKTLLMFIWTTVISFMMLPLLRDGRFPVLLIMSLAYLVWSLAVTRLMDWPLHWIYRHRRQGLPTDQVDPQLTHMQNRVEKFAYLSIGTSLLAVLLSGLAYLV